LLYDVEHIPGAQKLDWHIDLNDAVERDYIGREAFEQLLRSKGIDDSTTVVFYGDKNNWWATYALWVFRLFGHDTVKIVDGGRKKWIDEGRELSTETPSYEPTSYPIPARDDEKIRAFRDDVLAHLSGPGKRIDVRSPDEYKGIKLHMPDYPQEGAMRGGHIPGAKSVPWARAVNPDTGEFLGADQLRAIYEVEAGLKPGDDVIANNLVRAPIEK
jgi:thiosulfate/3-mercaptopyruvate sulfurtransferase